MDIETVSRELAEAAEAGRWEEATRLLWRRADVLDGIEAKDLAALRAAHAAGERVKEAVTRRRAELQTELQNLRAARRSTSAWRPYRETRGGHVDLSS